MFPTSLTASDIQNRCNQRMSLGSALVERYPPSPPVWNLVRNRVVVPTRQAYRLAESIPGLLKSFKIRAQCWILEQVMGARNRVGIGLSYRPARLHRLAELIPGNRFLGTLKVLKFELSSLRLRLRCMVEC
jgi:hypothetical protein